MIHLARNAEKGGGVLMSIILPKLKHSFICPIPLPVPVPDFRFRIPDFLVFHTPLLKMYCLVSNREGLGTSL